MLEGQFRLSITRQCRGKILRFKSNNWELVCNPPDKFFNTTEGHCKVSQEKIFKKFIKELSLHSKEDGTGITIWWDEEPQKFRISTLGCITPLNVNDLGLTFDELFLATLKNKSDFFGKLNKSYTYFFELCCSENRIVTKYSNNRIYLSCIRNNKTGEYVWGEFAKPLIDLDFNIKSPEKLLLETININSINNLRDYVEKNTNDTEDKQFLEGFVVYKGLIPVAKAKSSKYLTLHLFSNNDILATKNRIIEHYFEGNLDDVYSCLSDFLKTFADSLKDKVIKLNLEIKENINKIRNAKKEFNNFEVQKDYALYVLNNCPKQFSAFFFCNKEVILNNESTEELFTSWLIEHYKKFDIYWKADL